MAHKPGRWWETFGVESGKTVACTIGPLTLFLSRCPEGWHIRSESGDRGDAATGSGRKVVARSKAAMEGADRLMYGKVPAEVTLRPVLADRPVVVRPRYPAAIPPGEAATFYISSPVSVVVEIGRSGKAVREIPTSLMSDTWFGPNTREGELCYSTPTHARTVLDEVPRRPHRAITTVQVRNESRELLTIDRLSLPVPLLSVYGAADGSLWTQSVTLTQNVAGGELASLRVDERAPTAAPGAEFLSPPRRTPERGGLVRAFSGLFGG